MRWHWLFSSLALCASLSFAAQVDVNRATEAELDGINGFGPALSGRILRARQAATFTDWNDLMRRVSGIGPKKAIQLSNQGLTVNGTAFAPQPATQDKPRSDAH